MMIIPCKNISRQIFQKAALFWGSIRLLLLFLGYGFQISALTELLVFVSSWAFTIAEIRYFGEKLLLANLGISQAMTHFLIVLPLLALQGLWILVFST